METKLQYEPLDRVEADALAVIVFEEAGDFPLAKAWLDELKASGEFTGKPGEMAVLYSPAGLKVKRLVVVGAGKHDAFDGIGVRRAVGSTVRALKQKGVKTLAWSLAGAFTSSSSCCRRGSPFPG